MMYFSTGGARTQSPERLGLAQKAKVLLTGVNLPRPVARMTPRDVGMTGEAVWIPGGEQGRLAAWHIAVPQSRVRAVLFHGYGAEKSRLLGEARAFHDMGCDVLLVDFCGGGSSPGNRTTLGMAEADDVAAAVRYAEAMGGERRLLLYGQSMGAVAILRAVDVHGIRPDAIVLEATFDSLRKTVANRFRAMGLPAVGGTELLVFWGGVVAGSNGFAHRPVKYAQSVECPVVMLHGERDPRARLDEGRRVYEAIPARKQFVVFPGVAHEACIDHDPDLWREAVGQLVESVSRH
jgi:alpha-beta hydrolase superfamily lysophospholipase